MLGSALWALALALLVARLRDLIRPAIFRIVSIVCGLALGAFALIAASRVVFSVIGLERNRRAQ